MGPLISPPFTDEEAVMLKRIIILWTLALCPFLLIPGAGYGDESDIFTVTAVQPDVLLALDQTGSMQLIPSACPGYIEYGKCIFWVQGMRCFSDAETVNFYDHHPDFDVDGEYQQCNVMNWTNKPKYSTPDCAGPFHIAPYYTYSTDCSKLAIMKRAVKSILDANGNGTVEPNPTSPPGALSPDQTTLGLRLGYMRLYKSVSDTTGIDLMNEINSDYSAIWNNVSAADAIDGTALVQFLNKAKTYLDNNKAADPSKNCRKKFVVLITDGQDNFSCNGTGDEAQDDNYKRRKGSVTAAKALADAGYKVFVIGFGAQMPTYMINTLNWMAYYGGTDNTLVANSGNTSAITVSSNPCGEGNTNDPGYTSLNGYAYWALNETSLVQDLQDAVNTILQAKYLFSVASVAASRTSDANSIYMASFQPVNNDPFWLGHLMKYSIDSYGNIVGPSVFDAGDVLSKASPASRNIWTYVGGSWTKFLPPPDGPDWSTWQSYLGVNSNTVKSIVGYIQGDPAYNPDNWKLGDIFRSNPIAFGSPNSYFIDALSPDAFSTFRTNHQSRQRIIVAGSNDGQFRAFSDSDGSEKWSFIPPNLLPKLQYLAHSSNSGTLPAHMYFVDGPVSGADVWWGTGDGTSKNSGDWKTLLIFSEGRGVRDKTNTQASYLWSSSQYCDGNFNTQWTSTFQYYCGYWAFDVTNTSAATPTLIWPTSTHTQINPSATQGPYLGEPWSKMVIGRVKIGGNETWVGFIGGGFNSNSGDSNQGRGFFVVELNSGRILWSYTRGNDANMTYSLPASPAVVDTDGDGFIDTAYIGDLGGNIWRFTFCTGANGTACGTANWSGGKFFQSSSANPIYTTPSVARDSSSSYIWVFWGTGDKQNPNVKGTQDWFWGVKDDDRSSTHASGDLEDISGRVFDYARPGWYIALGSGEKVLADSAAFGAMITWTTYTPWDSADPCGMTGSSKLYALAMMPVAIGGVTYQPGAGLFANTAGNVPGTRSTVLGPGIAQVPIFSQKPGGTGATDVYISTSGGGGADNSVVSAAGMGDSPFKQRLQDTVPSAQLLHWLDHRIMQ